MDSPESAHWTLPPYGVPDATSEVSRVEGYYVPASCGLCGPGAAAWGAPTPTTTADELAEPLAA